MSIVISSTKLEEVHGNSGRASRFFAEAAVIMIWGEQILQLLVNDFEIITLVIAAVIIAVVVAGRRMRR